MTLTPVSFIVSQLEDSVFKTHRFPIVIGFIAVGYVAPDGGAEPGQQ